MKSVLIVEDDPMQRDALYVLMGHNNYWARMCGDVDEAMTEINKCLPDILITDLYLPGGDPLDLIRLVRSLPGGDYVKCILVTAGDRDRVATMKPELDALRALVLFKPYEPANLLNSLTV